MRRARPLLFLAVALACDAHQTAIMLEAQSELPAGALDEVVFAVSGPGLDGGSREVVAPLAGPEARAFPLTLVLVRDRSGGGPFTVAIDGRKAGTVTARAVPADGASSVAFVDRQVVRHRFMLRGAGTPTAVAPDAGLPPAPAVDAAPMMPEPPPDPTPPDGCPSVVTCGKETVCRCPPGCACQLTCMDDKCQVECAGAGTSCEIELGPAMSGNIRCSNGATCDVRGAGEVEKRDLKVACSMATCLVACGQPGCQLMCPGSATRACEAGVSVCNRDCP
jgi:hypothetical protein